MAMYRIHNHHNNTTWQGVAASVAEALSKAGWPARDCTIRQRTYRGGWAKPGSPRSNYLPATVNLREFQLKNCWGCKFADVAAVGSGFPCCTHYQGPQFSTDGYACERRREV